MIHKLTYDRSVVKTQLKYFIKNPGFFSILVLGDAGTGKSYIIKEVLNEDVANVKIGFYYPFEIGESEKEVSKIFENDYIIIKNIEELSVGQQRILTKALSTSDGTIGLGTNIGLKRIIFTSTYDVTQLTEGNNNLLERFWDRISQLVTKLPSFKDISSEIYKDFQTIWEKMEFKEFPKLPENGDFRYWLKESCYTFSGNFRDLDKIAILWHQYRLIEYNDSQQKFKSDVEARIFTKVRGDFEKLTHFPTQKADTSNTFEIVKGKTWEQIERDFQATFKAWAKINYKSIKEATKELNMPLRKMDKW